MRSLLAALLAALLVATTYTNVLAVCPPNAKVPVVIAQDYTGCAACPSVVAPLLAVHEVNTLQRRIMAATVDKLVDASGCALVELEAHVMDTQGSPMPALSTAISNYLQPSIGIAIVGGGASNVLLPLAATASTFGVLTVGDAATAAALGEPSVYSKVARVTVNDKDMAVGLKLMFQHFNWAAAALLTSSDAHGASIRDTVTAEFTGEVAVRAKAEFTNGDRASMKAALQVVAATSLRVIIATVTDSDAETFFDAVAELGMLSYTFILSDAITAPLAAATNPVQLSQRMAGCLSIQPSVYSPHDPTAKQVALPTVWSGLSATNPASVGSLVAGRGLSPFFFLGTALQLTTDPSISRAYDAVWAVAVAAAAAAKVGNVTADSLYTQLTSSSFAMSGTSGPLHFTSSGERVAEPASVFPVMNWRDGSWEPVGGAMPSMYQGVAGIIWSSGTSATPNDGLTCAESYTFSAQHARCIPLVAVVVNLNKPGTEHQQYLAGLMAVLDMINRRDTTLLPIFDELTLPVHPVLVDQGGIDSVLAANMLEVLDSPPGVISAGGVITSDGSLLLNPVSAVLRIPLVSPMSSITELSNKDFAPFIVRLVDTDDTTVYALANLIRDSGFRKIGIVATRTAESIVFFSDLQQHADRMGITIAALEVYDPTIPKECVEVVTVMAEAYVRVIVMVGSGPNTDIVLGTAQRLGILGRGYAWITSPSVPPTLYKDYLTRAPDMAQNMQGFLRVVPQPAAAAASTLAKLTTWWHAQNASSAYWTQLQDALNLQPHERVSQSAFDTQLDKFLPMVMDTVIHIALAERLLQEEPRVEKSRINRLVATRLAYFDGFSGEVRLDPKTFDRRQDTMDVVVESFVYNNVTKSLRGEVVGRWSSSRIVYQQDIVWPGNLHSPPNDGTSCAEGWFVHDLTLQCTACDPGSHYDTVARECKLCTPGTFAPTAGLTQCVGCASIQGFAGQYGATKCNACPTNTQHSPGSAGVNITDCVCMRATFHPDGLAGEECLPCPAGAVCDGGSAPPVAIEGHWRFGPTHETFVKCPGVGACLGVPVDEVAPSGIANASRYKSGCAEGYHGNLCASCDAGYGRSANHSCTLCKDNPLLILWFIGTVILIIVIMLYLIYKAIASQGRVQANGVLRKIFISHAQIMGILLQVELEWPAPVRALFEVQNLVGSPANEEWVVADCQMPTDNTESSRFLRSQIIFAIAPLVIVVVVIGMVFAWKRARTSLSVSFRRKESDLDIATRSLGRGDYIVLSLVIIFYTMHPFLTRRSLLMFSCVTFNSWARANGALVDSSFSLHTEDYQIECGSGDWLTAQALLGGPMVLLFVVGVPITLFYQLRKHAWQPMKLSSRTRVVFGFLFLGFKKKYYYWEITTMLRKAALAGIAVFIRGRAQLISVGLVLMLSLVAQMASNPYQNHRLDHAETVSLAVQTMNMLFGQFFFEGVLVRQSTRVSATMVLLALNIGFLLWMIWISYMAIRRSGQAVSAYSTRDIKFVSTPSSAFSVRSATSVKSPVGGGWDTSGSTGSLLRGQDTSFLGMCCCCFSRKRGGLLSRGSDLAASASGVDVVLSPTAHRVPRPERPGMVVNAIPEEAAEGITSTASAAGAVHSGESEMSVADIESDVEESKVAGPACSPSRTTMSDVEVASPPSSSSRSPSPVAAGSPQQPPIPGNTSRGE